MARHRVYHKITVMFVLISACLLSGVFFYLKRNIRDYTYQNIRRDMLQKVSLARVLAERSADADPQELVIQIAQSLRLRATMIDLQGVVRGDSDTDADTLSDMENHLYRPEVQGALDGVYGESKRFSTSVREDFLYMAMRYNSGQNRGIIRLALRLDEIAIISQRINGILIFSFALAFVFSILASYVASLLISKPIEKIAHGARRIAGGNFDSRIFVPGDDEISNLAKTFNDMAEQIQERISDAAVGKSQLEAVFSSMAEGVLVVDEKGHIFLMNDALRSLLSIDADPIGRRPLEVIRNADIQDMIARAQSEGSGLSQEIVFSTPEQRIMRVQSAPVRSALSGVAGAVLAFHDITELRRLENIRKEFVANVSHELRTPVASIKGYAETLIDGALHDKENAGDFVRIISEEAERLVKLIEDLLDLSAIESGKMFRGLSPCRLDAVLHKAIESVRAQAQQARVTIETRGFEGVSVLGDELGLYRMFLNLIENAVKYNREGGRVDIAAARQAGMLEMTFKDTGIGIPDEDLPRIFERFYRVDKARSRQLGGTGLGLAIVKYIVQAHGGCVSVESAPNEGSVFTVTLPCE